MLKQYNQRHRSQEPEPLQKMPQRNSVAGRFPARLHQAPSGHVVRDPNGMHTIAPPSCPNIATGCKRSRTTLDRMCRGRRRSVSTRDGQPRIGDARKHPPPRRQFPDKGISQRRMGFPRHGIRQASQNHQTPLVLCLLASVTRRGGCVPCIGHISPPMAPGKLQYNRRA